MRKIKVITREIEDLWEKHHKKLNELKEELKTARLHKQNNCPHPEDKIKIQRQGYMEEGRMSRPVEWEEKVCKRCGKILATRTEKTRMSDWS